MIQQKVLVIVSTAEKEKALAGVLWATNAIKERWVEDVKVCFFGPFEALLAGDNQVQVWVSELEAHETPRACKFISDSHNVSDKLIELGIQVEYIGERIASYVNQGYVPLVF